MTELHIADAAIRQLHARYTDAVYRKDLAAFGDCFAEDAEWRITGLVLRGRKNIVDFMAAAFPKYRFILMNFRTPVLDVGNGTATGRTYVSEQSVMADGRPFGPIGIYYERFVDQGDRWRFSWRLFLTAYSGPPDLTGSYFENPDFGAPPAMPALDQVSFDRSGILTQNRSTAQSDGS
jgi:ketosteroid isomerase-like protein